MREQINYFANDISHRKVVLCLAEKAYDFFEEEYNTSDEIHKTIEMYSTLLVGANIASFYNQDMMDEVIDKVIKPLYLSYDKLEELIFDMLNNAVSKIIYNRNYYITQALNSNIEELKKDIIKELSNKLKSEFVWILFPSIQKHYEKTLQKYYPNEYQFLNNTDGVGELWNELYGKTLELIDMCLQAMGAGLSLIDKGKIFYGDTKFVVEENDKEIKDIYSAGNIDASDVKEKSSYSNIEAGRNVVVPDQGGTKFDKIKAGGTFIAVPQYADFNKVVADINNSDLDESIKQKLIPILEEIKQAVKSKDIIKQDKAKRKFWDVGKGISTSSQIISILKNLGILEYFKIL